MTQPLITLDSVAYQYGHYIALHDVSGQFAAGSLTAMAGPNGAGKSTLLKVIAGIMRPQKGFVRIHPDFLDKIGYLPQTSTIERDYPITVLQAVSTGLWPQVGSIKAITSELKVQITAALGEVGLNGFEQRQVGELSGGQFQRMLFARLILQNPQIILLDEPFAAIDAETTSKLMHILLKWHEQGRTIVCVLHDLMLIRKYFPESFVLAGKCLGRGHTHTLFEQKLLSFDLDMAELVSPEEHKATP
ncbi:MAG: ABC transporter ATP-binding protein [Alphaproteobacteria bacterium]|nr:ABC transporter ATP-binding protein [Alphaproteobacteria bacterium]